MKMLQVECLLCFRGIHKVKLSQIAISCVFTALLALSGKLSAQEEWNSPVYLAEAEADEDDGDDEDDPPPGSRPRLDELRGWLENRHRERGEDVPAPRPGRAIGQDWSSGTEIAVPRHTHRHWGRRGHHHYLHARGHHRAWHAHRGHGRHAYASHKSRSRHAYAAHWKGGHGYKRHHTKFHGHAGRTQHPGSKSYSVTHRQGKARHFHHRAKPIKAAHRTSRKRHHR